MRKICCIVLFVVLLAFDVSVLAQDACPVRTNEGVDFWVTFINNGTRGNPENIYNLFITAGDSAAMVTVENPGTGWSSNISLAAFGSQVVTLPYFAPQSGMAVNNGYHITSTTKISVLADNYIPDSWDIAMVLPTHALRSRYIVQDISLATDYPSGVAFVAAEDSTVLSMVLPHSVENVSTPAGGLYTSPMLMAGQSLFLSNAAGHGFNGMVVNSNGKPFATFQGHSCARVGNAGSQYGRDHMFEQALPTDLWGTDFLVTPTSGRTEGDVIMVTASADGCTVTANGVLRGTLSEGASMELSLPSGSTMHIVTSQPAYVCLYTYSFHNGGTYGDPCSITIPPSDRWVCRAAFFVNRDNTDVSDEQYIPMNGHRLNVITHTADVPYISINGTSNMLNFTQTSDGYSYATVAIQPNTTYSIDGQGHRFSAHAYAMGKWVGAGFTVGMELNDYNVSIDTVYIYDTVCQDVPYDTFCIHLDAGNTHLTGTSTYTCRLDNTEYIVQLTVLDANTIVLYDSIVFGDTLEFADSSLMLAGSYTFHYTNRFGCDSTVTLVLTYRNVSITSSAAEFCPGDSVTLTADGLQVFLWTADPADPSLDQQQGLQEVVVAPVQTTVYSLVDDHGGIIKSITLSPVELPSLCVDVNRDILDFDYPTLIFDDCSDGSRLTTWRFDDGLVMRGQHVRRLFHHPLPDSISVVMTSCSGADCCVDTTLTIPMKIRSVWFPNIVTPLSDDANSFFGCSTSYDVESYSLTVYNRWGLEVYSTNNINDRWNFSDRNGVRLPQGAYVFVFSLRDKDGTVEYGTRTVTVVY